MNFRARMLVAIPFALWMLAAAPLLAQAIVTATPPPPKFELFLGYTHFGTWSSNTSTGNRMVGLNGGSASLAFNFSRHLALVADFGGYDDSQLQLTGTGANQPIVVNSSGTAYTYLFGPRFSFRNSSRLTPFVQVLGGGVHASPVTVANCSTACIPLPAQNAFALTAGGGLDLRLTHRISLRAVQAEYMMTRFAALPSGSSASQNDLRLSTGLLFGFGGKEPAPPVQLACSVNPATAFPGDPFTVTATASNLNPRRKPTYTWSSTGGTVAGQNSTTGILTTGLAPGTYTVSGHVTEGPHLRDQADCTANFTIQAFAPPTISCSASPTTVVSGDPSAILAQATSPQGRTLAYTYTATAGAVTGTTASATLTTSGVPPGDITVTCAVADDLGKQASSTTVVSVTAPPAVAAPQTSELCSVSFERDPKRPVRVDNEAKGCLDNVALELQHESTGRLLIIGSFGPDESRDAAAQRTLNVRQYLIDEKGIDSSRIELRTSGSGGRTVSNVFVPAGATYNGPDTTPVDPTIHRSGEPYGKPKKIVP